MSTSAASPNHRSAWLVALALLVAGAANAQAPTLPADVRAFLEQREQCDHWRSEEPYNRERRLEIEQKACRTCQGTDARLAALRAKYLRDGTVMSRLKDLDAAVEPRDEQARRACGSASTAAKAPPATASAKTQPAPARIQPLPPACAQALTRRMPGWQLPQPTEEVAAWAREQRLNAAVARGDFDANGSPDIAALVVHAGRTRLTLCLNPSRGAPKLVAVTRAHCSDLVFTKRARTKVYNFETRRHERLARDGASVRCFGKAGETFVMTASGRLRSIVDSD